LTNAENALNYFAVVGQMPFLDYVFDKSPVYKVFGPPGFGTIMAISIDHLMDRYAGKNKSYHDDSHPDFFDQFIKAKRSYPDVVDDAQIIS
jgi:hypothetical protein